MANTAKTAKAQRGITLSEMLIVVAIVGATFSLALPLYLKSVTAKQQDMCDAQFYALVQAEESYRIRNRAYTTSMSSLGFSTLQCPGDISGSAAAAYVITVDSSSGKRAFTITANRCGLYQALKMRRLQYDEDGISVTNPVTGVVGKEAMVINNDVPCT